MKAMAHRLSAWMFALGLATLPLAASAYSYVMMQDADLFDTAEGVATARVERVWPAGDGDRETRYELRILKAIAGPRLAAREALVLPGTFDAPNLNFVVDGVPQIAPGTTVLLFYLRRADGVLQSLQLSLGLFARLETPHGAYYVRHLEGQREFGKRASTRRYHVARVALPFERWLVDRSRGVVRAPDYLREQVAIETGAKFTFSIFNFPVPGPGRWFQFDSGQVLPWTSRPDGQANTTFNEVTSLQQALAAWTDDPASRIQMTYTGTQASSPTCDQSNNPGCFTGHVVWNDPLGEVPGTYNCTNGGVLGIGGSIVFSNGQQFAGQTWYPRFLATVTVNDNAGCAMDDFNGADGAELLTHEIGHSLAFGHACGDGSSPACNTSVNLNEATMRASLHADGRGAVLGTDDRAGAAIAYPAPVTCSGVCVFRSGFE